MVIAIRRSPIGGGVALRITTALRKGQPLRTKKLTFSTYYTEIFFVFLKSVVPNGGSVAEWLACWTQAQKARFQIAAATLLGNSLRQTVHTHCASELQAWRKVMAAYRRVYDSHLLQADCQEPGSAPETYAL